MDEKERFLICGLAQKKNKVVKAVEAIAKTGKNVLQNYKYAEESEVIKHIREALIDAGLAFSVKAHLPIITHQIPTKNGSVPQFVVPLECVLTDVETGYSETCEWYGAAFDSGDKAISKAYTAGIKYFFMKTFMLPTFDDIENDKTAPKVAESAQDFLTMAHTLYKAKHGSNITLPKFKDAVLKQFKRLPTRTEGVEKIVAEIKIDTKDPEAGMMDVDEVSPPPKDYCPHCKTRVRLQDTSINKSNEAEHSLCGYVLIETPKGK